MLKLLTLHVRKLVELLKPVFADLDDGVGILTLIRQTPVVVGGRDELLSVLRIERVHHVVEVSPIRPTAFGQLFREVLHEVRVVLELWVEGVDTELVELGHVDHLDVDEVQQLLLLSEDHPEEVLVDHGVGRHVELHCQKL